MSLSWTSLGALSTLQVKWEEIICISLLTVLKSSECLENSPCRASNLDEYLWRWSAGSMASLSVGRWVRTLPSAWLIRNCNFWWARRVDLDRMADWQPIRAEKRDLHSDGERRDGLELERWLSSLIGKCLLAHLLVRTNEGWISQSHFDFRSYLCRTELSC